MRRGGRSIRCAAALFVLSCLTLFACAQAVSSNDGSALVGDWVGESLCTKDSSSACRDEKVVYHIRRAPDADGNVEIDADKIVDGKPVNMGAIRLKYDAEKKTLRGDLETPRYRGVWEFSINGDTMEGTLTSQPEKKVTRNVSLKKDAAHK
jgi:hypothetical protein